MFTIKEYFELNPEKKNVEWANRMIMEFRQKWQPLVDEKDAKENMEYLLSTQPMDKVKGMFKDWKKTKLSFGRISVVEKYRNILIAERDKSGIFIGLNSIDPSVVEKSRKKDRDLLANRKAIEATVSTLNAKVGDAPYKIPKTLFNGNVDSFDEIGLDSEEDEDLNYFFATHWRLLQEIKGEIPLAHFVAANKLKQKIPQYCNDILAKKAISGQCFVNQVSGKIEMKYIAPELVKIIVGEEKDFQDAPAIGYEKSVSVSRLIQHLGNEFDPNSDWQTLMTSINQYHSRQYTGLTDFGGNFLWRKEGATDFAGRRTCTWHDFLQFKLTLGYIEFKTNDATSYKSGKSVHGNSKMLKMKNPEKEIESEHYQKESYYNEVTYKAYFIPTSTNTQRLFKYGKLFHQTVEGGEDEYSCYSICAYKEVGPTAVTILKPYVEMIQQAWTKFEWMVRKAKPAGRTYNYESLVQIAINMVKEGTSSSKINALLEKFEEGINDIYVIPTIGGEKIGGGGNPYFDKKNGLDTSAKDFLDVIVYCNEHLAADFGINSIREAYSPSPNDGFKLQMAALQQSRNATEYISTMLMNMLQHMGAQTLLMIQDIIKYKTSIPYQNT